MRTLAIERHGVTVCILDTRNLWLTATTYVFVPYSQARMLVEQRDYRLCMSFVRCQDLRLARARCTSTTSASCLTQKSCRLLHPSLVNVRLHRQLCLLLEFASLFTTPKEANMTCSLGLWLIYLQQQKSRHACKRGDSAAWPTCCLI